METSTSTHLVFRTRVVDSVFLVRLPRAGRYVIFPAFFFVLFPLNHHTSETVPGGWGQRPGHRGPGTVTSAVWCVGSKGQISLPYDPPLCIFNPWLVSIRGPGSHPGQASRPSCFVRRVAAWAPEEAGLYLYTGPTLKCQRCLLDVNMINDKTQRE